MSRKLSTMVKRLGIEPKRAELMPSSGDFLDHNFDVSPEDFLERAEQDYEAGGSAALLNSITNAKRAIRCQIDKVIYCIGFNAPKIRIKAKIELLRNVGFVAPRILAKVDAARNLLEHEYKGPKLKQVEEALDVAALFVEATNRSINPIGSEFSMGNRDELVPATDSHSFDHFANELWFGFESDKRRFCVSGWRHLKRKPRHVERASVGTVIVKANEPIYLDILRMALIVEKNRESKSRDAARRFVEALAPAWHL